MKGDLLEFLHVGGVLEERDEEGCGAGGEGLRPEQEDVRWTQLLVYCLHNRADIVSVTLE